MSTDRYTSPLSERYASRKCSTFFTGYEIPAPGKLWIALAETEKELGLNITQEQIDELKAHADDINYDVARAREKKCVMMLCPCICLRCAVSESKGNYPSGSHILLCRR